MSASIKDPRPVHDHGCPLGRHTYACSDRSCAPRRVLSCGTCATDLHHGRAYTSWRAHPAPPSGAVVGAASADSGRFSVADPRLGPRPEPLLPAAGVRLVAVIRALDGTWHRPFTTLELAALQSLIDPGDPLCLEGTSDSAWRERIGNAVPRDTAAAIASEMGRALLLAWSGQTFALGSTPIWVRPVAIAIALRQP